MMPTLSSPVAHHVVVMTTCVAFSDNKVDLIHKPHNAPVPYPIMHHFVTEMCRCVHISVTKWCIMGYLLCIVGFVRWVYWSHEVSPWFSVVKCRPHVCTKPYLTSYLFVSDVLTPTKRDNVSPSSGTALNKGKAFCNLLIPVLLVCFYWSYWNQCPWMCAFLYDGSMVWERFPNYFPFVRESTGGFPRPGSWRCFRKWSGAVCATIYGQWQVCGDTIKLWLKLEVKYNMIRTNPFE